MEKFFRKVTGGRITEEQSFATNAFLWEKFYTLYIFGFTFNVLYSGAHFQYLNILFLNQIQNKSEF